MSRDRWAGIPAPQALPACPTCGEQVDFGGEHGIYEGKRYHISCYPFAKESNEAKAERDEARAKLARVEALHISDGGRAPNVAIPTGQSPFCEYCGLTWPCQTIRALAGTP